MTIRTAQARWELVTRGMMIALLCSVIVTARGLAQANVSPRVEELCLQLPSSVERVHVCLKAVELHPADAELYRGLADAYAKTGDISGALASYKEVTRLRPNDFTARYNSGLLLEVLGRFNESRHVFEDAAILAPRDGMARWHIGAALYSTGDYSGAMRAFRAAAELQPGDASAWSYMALCAANLHRPHEALGYWQRALLENPKYFDSAQPGERQAYQSSLRVAGNHSPRPTAVPTRP